MTLQHLYRLYDADENLLYVGISKSAMNRIGEHLRTQPWASNIARMTIDHFPDRVSVERAERLAIASENPIHNKHRYSLEEVPIHELWRQMSVNERRMVGQVLLNISRYMQDDELDDHLQLVDEHYETISDALERVGYFFAQDQEPDDLFRSVFAVTQRTRFLAIQKWSRANELEELEQANKDLRRKVKELKSQIAEYANLVAS